MNVAQALDATAEELVAELRAARDFLLRAVNELPAERWAEQPSPNYSPVGWHVGHCATVMARWLLGENPADASGGFFDPTLTPKEERSALPRKEQLFALLEQTLERSARCVRLGRVPRVPGLPPAYLVHHIAQHELQHAEHARVVAALVEERLHRPGRAQLSVQPELSAHASRLEYQGGPVVVGSSDANEAYDNEREPHPVTLAPFWLDAHLVTVARFEEFVAAGGYRDERLWTPEGMRFLQRGGITAPLGWIDGKHPDGAEAAQHPVTGVSWYEADAFARARGVRLPTETEWEAASAGRRFPLGETAPTAGIANVDGVRLGTSPVGGYGHPDFCGNVWEWTSSWFEAYPGFHSYPYAGYSAAWFMATHRVLRGGSWATAGRICRSTFRNWYAPGFREIPAGFRCAGDLR